MDENIPGFSIIDIKHKKERKELQAQIQALKKIAKNDKTKRKGLISDITKIENELEERQKNELEALRETLDNNLKVTETAIATTTRISKAQKRRDKKSQLEKDRVELIRLQEIENLNGPRNSEHKAISERLKSNSLELFQIPSDGDCLYKAIVHQLELIKRKCVSVEDLRLQVATYIKNNKDDFILFMYNQDSSEMLTDREFSEYCDKISTTKAWGGQLELRAICNVLKCPVKIIQATGPDSIDQGFEFGGPPLVITYHRHMYSLGEHYNSTCPVKQVLEAE